MPRIAFTRRQAGMALGVVLIMALGLALRRPAAPSGFATVAVTRGPLNVTLSEAGTLRPAQALTYRSRVPGREIEITWLAPEGSQVRDGDLLARLDTTELESDLAKATQALRQAQLDAQVAEAERQASNAAFDSLSGGRGALDAEEAQFNLKIAEQKAERLKKEYESFVPLLEKGFVTRDELDQAAQEAAQAQGAAELARRRAAIVTEQSVPQQRQRATLDVAHRNAQLEVARQRLGESSGRVAQLKDAIASCAIHAEHGGLVVYEANVATSPQRKVRVGDRVTPSQGIITIPEVSRMLADTSVREADLHRVSPGRAAVITLEAYPRLPLTGRVVSVGTVARMSPDRPVDGKRFDVVVDLDRNTADLRPDMTATVEIEVSRRRDALLVPVNAVFDRDGQHVVHVVRSGSTETRRVVLGESDDVYVEVMDGVREGEYVRLSDVVLDGSTPRPAPRLHPDPRDAAAGRPDPARQ